MLNHQDLGFMDAPTVIEKFKGEQDVVIQRLDSYAFVTYNFFARTMGVQNTRDQMALFH